MQKRIVTIYLLIFAFGAFGQHQNSKLADWHFYHPKSFKGDTTNFRHFKSGLTVLCDTVKTKGKLKSIEFFPTLREEWDNSICENYSCSGSTKPSILGNELFFKNDSLQLKFDSSKFTIDLSISINDSSILFNSDSLTIKITLDSLKFQKKLNIQDSVFYFSLHPQGQVDSNKLELYKRINLVYGLKLGFIETPDFYKILHGPFYLKEDLYWLGFANNPNIGGWDIHNEFFFDFNVGDEFYIGRASGFYPLYTQEYQRFITKDTSDIDILKYSYFKYGRGDTFDPDIRPFPISYWQGNEVLNIERKDTVTLPYSRVWVPNYLSKQGFDFSFPVNTMYFVNNRYCISSNSDPFFSFEKDLYTSTFGWLEVSVDVRDIYCQGLGHVYRNFWHETWPNYSFGLIDYKKGSEVLTGIESPFWETTLEQDFYPNPTSRNLFFKESAFISNIQIFDVSGKLVFQLDRLDENQINVSQFSEGTYFISYQKNGNKLVEKFIISR